MNNAQKPKKISLLLADVDGTLVDSKKRITPRALEAVERLLRAGIDFAVTSGRPPRGMRMIADQIRLTAPIAAFNGGVVVRPIDFTVVDSYVLTASVAREVAQRISSFGLDVWVYAGLDWYLRDHNAPHREKEQHTVQFPPTVVKDFEKVFELGVAKIVGVSDDLDLVARCETEVQQEFAEAVHSLQTTPSRDLEPSVSAARSQPYYLDVTHPKANKGAVVEMLSQNLGYPAQEIVTIGDMPNDVLMFKKSAFSIAMGQAAEEVKSAANRVTAGLNDEGFARAIEDFILGDR